MSFVNAVTKEVNCKVVYAGPGMGGKTTNIQFIYEMTHGKGQGDSKIMNLSAENERTLFFDFLPLGLGEVRGYKVRLHLYSIPGQIFYDASRDFVLRGMDGVVFVFDSNRDRMDANLEAFEAFKSAMARLGLNSAKIPMILQYNKRDLPNAATLLELEELFNPEGKKTIEAIASQGVGVMESLESISQMVLDTLRGGKS